MKRGCDSLVVTVSVEHDSRSVGLTKSVIVTVLAVLLMTAVEMEWKTSAVLIPCR